MGIRLLIWNSLYKWYVKLFGNKDDRRLRYKTAICLIFKDEAPFLQEWIDIII